MPSALIAEPGNHGLNDPPVPHKGKWESSASYDKGPDRSVVGVDVQGSEEEETAEA